MVPLIKLRQTYHQIPAYIKLFQAAILHTLHTSYAYAKMMTYWHFIGINFQSLYWTGDFFLFVCCEKLSIPWDVSPEIKFIVHTKALIGFLRYRTFPFVIDFRAWTIVLNNSNEINQKGSRGSKIGRTIKQIEGNSINFPVLLRFSSNFTQLLQFWNFSIVFVHLNIHSKKEIPPNYWGYSISCPKKHLNLKP